MNNFLLIYATYRSKISSNQKRLFCAVSLYPLLFFANTPCNEVKNQIIIRKRMASGDYLKEKEILLNMEVKLRLLDLEGMELPASAPVIPPPPPNLNFSLNNWPRADHSLTSFYWQFTTDYYYYFVKRLSSEKDYYALCFSGISCRKKSGRCFQI